MPKVTSPKVKALMKKLSDENAAKHHRKFIASVNYVMKHWPDPCTNLRSVYAKDCKLPRVVGLTGGKDLKAMDIFDFTMKMIVNANPTRADLNYSVRTFLRSIKGYMPEGLCISDDWSNFKARRTDPEVLDTANKFEEWVTEYYNKIESQLLGFYMTIGDRSGAQYIKVLERRFRDHFAANLNVTSKSEVKAEVKEEVKATVDGSVNFNFTVAESGRSIPGA